MKLPLCGDSYQNRQIASGAAQCLNWYRETIEDPSGSGKSTKILRQTPGFHLLANITTHAGNVRGFWSGGGRLFVVVGHYLYEVDEAGAIVSTNPLNILSTDTTPVWMGGNGNQLGIVADGYFFLDNGSGPVAVRFTVGGTCDVGGAGPPYFDVTRKTGSPFPSNIASYGVIINGTYHSVAAWIDADHITLGDGVADLLTDVEWESAAGDFVTAVTGAYMDGQFYVQRPSSPSTIYQTYTDLEIDAAIDTNITSAADPFGASSEGQALIVYSGLGFIPGTYIITSVAAGVATVDRAIGAVGSTGGIATEYTTDPDLGRQVAFSAVNDGTDWRGLDFFTKESSPDYIQSIMADRGQLYVFGQENETEVWGNDPNTGRPVRGPVIPEASAARFGPESMGEHVYFIGGPPSGNPVAYRLDGYTATRISTHAVESAWARKSVPISSAVTWDYLEDGHYFWVICFSDGTSWAYDATERDWQERTAWTGAAYAPYRPWFHTFIAEWGTNGQHIVGDYASGKIFVMSSEFYDEEGGDVRRVRILPYIYAGGGKRVYVDRVDLEMATGLIPSGAEPTIELDWSLDNGKTFSTPESAGFGSNDETNKRVFWIAQGSAETAMLPRITLTGQVETTLIDCEGEVALGDS